MNQHLSRQAFEASDPVLPDWLPERVRDYCDHVISGKSMRAVAHTRDGHASTVLRHVQSIEVLRDDPLIDRALNRLTCHFQTQEGTGDPMLQKAKEQDLPCETEINREARRILRRLSETDASLVLAGNLSTAVVLRGANGKSPVKTAVVDQKIAQMFALRDWINCVKRGKISRYEITHAGKKALKRLLAEDGTKGQSDPLLSPFQEQHRDWAERDMTSPEGVKRRVRINLAESPLTSLGRRKDSDGKPFLSTELVSAGERLREDFETANMGPRITQNWERFLTGGRGGAFSSDNRMAEGPMAARERVRAALSDLGPGLGDIALRCCCFLEGMEAAEKRMGWSARSGKIVLRIALQRLRLHYETA